MLKYSFTFLLFLFEASFAQAQISGKSVSSFTTQSGTVLHVGDTVRVGRGSGTNGSFKYIFIPSNVFTGSPQKFFTSNFTGSTARINDLKATNSSTYGTQTVAVIKGEGLLSGCIVINPAEDAGELRTKPVQRSVAASAAPVSANVTDELIKLKQLLDAKVLTPAEFTAQKNRLLKQQADVAPSKISEVSEKSQTANEIYFKVVSAVGNRKDQTVTVTLRITNKDANKATFNTNVRSCTSDEGDVFTLRSSAVGAGANITLFTDAPVKATYTFAGILPKISSIKLLAVPFGYINQASNSYEQGQIELRDISIIWK